MRNPGMSVAGDYFSVLTRPSLVWILAAAPLLVQFGSSGWVSEENIFIFFSLFVVGFGVAGALWFRKTYGKGFLLNPLVSSCSVFVIGFGVSNYVLFTDADVVDYYLGADAYVYLNKAMILTLFAMISLWAGYRGGVGTWLAGKWDSSVLAKRFLRREYRLDYRVIMVLIIVSISCRLLQVRFGLFGYTSTTDEWIRLAALTQWLHAGRPSGFYPCWWSASPGLRGHPIELRCI